MTGRFFFIVIGIVAVAIWLWHSTSMPEDQTEPRGSGAAVAPSTERGERLGTMNSRHRFALVRLAALAGRLAASPKPEAQLKDRDLEQPSPEYWSDRLPPYCEEIMRTTGLDHRLSALVQTSASDFIELLELEATDLVSVDCGGHLCKVIMRHETEDEYNRFSGISGPEIWTGRTLVQNGRKLDDGSWLSESFFSDGAEIDMRAMAWE